MMDKLNEINYLLKKFLDTSNKTYYNKLSKLLIKDPKNNYLRFNLAVLESKIGLIEKALKNYKHLINTEYKIKALTNIYLMEIECKNYISALKYIEMLLDINNNDQNIIRDKSNVLNSLGLYYQEIRDSNKAENFFQQALKINYNSIEIINNLAGYHREEGNYNKAIELYKKALLLDEKNLTLINNLSKTYFDMNKIHDSKKYALIGKKIDKDNDDLKNNLSFILLKEAKYKEAWENFDGRLGLKDFRKNNLNSDILIKKIFKGHKINYEDNILVIREQGIGDEILYSSMYTDLIKNYKNVTIECDGRLKNLFNKSFKKDNCFKNFSEISGNLNKLKKFDVILYAGSLGKFFRKKSRDFTGKPYIFAEKEKIKSFKLDLNKFKKKYNIGISWKSFKNRYSGEKSIKLNELKNIFDIKDCNFLNLQYGDIMNELNSFNNQSKIKINNIQSLDIYNDFDNVAAVLSCLDLFITVSNSTAHLAGALGVNTILIKPINHALYHYWNQDDNITPWYKSVTLLDKKKFLVKENIIEKLIKKNLN